MGQLRAAFWASLSEDRRRAIVDLDWHSLRHFCSWHFYVNLGFSDELDAYQSATPTRSSSASCTGTAARTP